MRVLWENWTLYIARPGHWCLILSLPRIVRP